MKLSTVKQRIFIIRPNIRLKRRNVAGAVVAIALVLAAALSSFSSAYAIPLQQPLMMSVSSDQQTEYWANGCRLAMGESLVYRVITEVEFYKLLRETNFSLSYNQSLEQKFSINGLSTESPIYPKLLNFKDQLVGKAKTCALKSLDCTGELIDYIVATMGIKRLWAERLLLFFNYELGGLNVNLINGILHSGHTSQLEIERLTDRFKTDLEAHTESPFRDTYILGRSVVKNSYPIFLHYFKLFKTEVLNRETMSDGSPVTLNANETLDSAHALRYSSTASVVKGFPPAITISGFFRAELERALYVGADTRKIELHFLRFVQQLLMLDEPIKIGIYSIPLDLISVKTAYGTLRLDVFKQRYARFHKFSVYKKNDVNDLYRIFGKDFLTIVTSNLTHSDRLKESLKPKVSQSPITEYEIQQRFVNSMARVFGLPIQADNHLMQMEDFLVRYVFYPEPRRLIDYDSYKYFIYPSYAIDDQSGVDGENLVPADDLESFFAKDVRIFASKSDGALGYLLENTKFTGRTNSLYLKLNKMVELIPAGSNYERLMKLLDQLKLETIKIDKISDSGDGKNFPYAQKTYRLLYNLFLEYNSLAREYNDSYRKASDPELPMIDLAAIKSKKGLRIASNILRRRGYVIAQALHKASVKGKPDRSRLAEITKVHENFNNRRKAALKTYRELTEQEIASFRAARGGLFQLNRMSKALNISLFSAGQVDRLFVNLIRYVESHFGDDDSYFADRQIDESEESSKDQESFLKLRQMVYNISFGSRDGAKVRSTDGVVQKICTALNKLAKTAAARSETPVAYDPDRICDEKQIVLFFESIPSLKQRLSELAK